MTNDILLRYSIRDALEFCRTHHIQIPPDLLDGLEAVGIAAKAIGDITAISAEYHDAITQAIISYFNGERRRQNANADFRKACTQAFGDGFDTGWQDGGGQLPTDPDANDWLNARTEEEFGHISVLFSQMKDLKGEEGFDYFAYATARADGYTKTLLAVYGMGKIMAAKNKMLTFAGPNGQPDNICQRNNGTCVRLMGQRHRASWWVAHDLLPYPGNANYDCGAWECRHRLEDDDGNKFTQ